MSSDLKTRLQSDLNTARKERDKQVVLVLSTALSEIRNKEIADGGEVGDDGVIQVLSKGIKQRKDAAEQMRAAGRDELADVEEEQAEVLGRYLPAGLDEAEVRAMIRAAIDGGAEQMGAIMAQIMPRIRGRFDGKEANRLVREEMGA